MVRRSFCALLLLALPSCFAVTDLDRFHGSAAPNVNSNFMDFKLTMRGMDSHVDEYVEYRIIDANNTIQSRGILYPLGGVAETVYAPGAIPKQNGPFHLDFWADHDRNGQYTPPTSDGTFPDHGWRLPLPDAPNSADGNGVEIVFDHNTSFNNLDEPAPPATVGSLATIHLVNMQPLMGKRVEVRLSDASAGRVVALYRVPVLNDATYDATVPGMIDEDVTYDVDVYTDDGNDASPGNVAAFRFTKVSDASGLDATFDPAIVPKVSDAPPP